MPRNYLQLLVWVVRSVLAFTAGLRQVAASASSSPPSKFCDQIVFPLGFSCKEFQVYTDDGYILVLHRIQYSSTSDKPASSTSASSRQEVSSPVVQPRNEDVEATTESQPSLFSSQAFSTESSPVQSLGRRKSSFAAQHVSESKSDTVRERTYTSITKTEPSYTVGMPSSSPKSSPTFKRLVATSDAVNDSPIDENNFHFLGSQKTSRQQRIQNRKIRPQQFKSRSSFRFNDTRTTARSRGFLASIPQHKITIGESESNPALATAEDVTNTSSLSLSPSNKFLLALSSHARFRQPVQAPSHSSEISSTLNSAEVQTRINQDFVSEMTLYTVSGNPPDTPTSCPLNSSETSNMSLVEKDSPSPAGGESPEAEIDEFAPSPTKLSSTLSISPSPTSSQSSIWSSDSSSPTGDITRDVCIQGNADAPINTAPASAPESSIVNLEPVLLMHPEFFNGDVWFKPINTTGSSSEERLLPLMLIDAGYDVWIGHQRATLWGHDHISLKFDEKAYWEWTWDEQAQFDVPAILDFIYSETNSSVHYIGMSQGAAVGAAAATIPNVSHLLKSLALLGPTVYRGNTSSLVLDAWAFLFGSSMDEAYYNEGFQNGAFNYSMEFPEPFIDAEDPLGNYELYIIAGPNCCLGSLHIDFSNGWDGTTSFKNLLHFQQGVRTDNWTHFDYGNATENMKMYEGSPVPPTYEPASIPVTLPMFLIYGGSDVAAPVTGIQRFLSLLKESAQTLELPAYAHFDLGFSSTRTLDVFVPVIEFLQQISSL